MKIIDTHWEKRNLGVDSCEIIIENNDFIGDITQILKTPKKYVVVKVSTKRFDVQEKLSSLGYIFVESLLNLKINVKEAILNDIQIRMNSNVTYSIASKSEVNGIFEEILRGVFDSDRISMDFNFSKQISNERYVYWIEDELKLGAELYKVSYKNHLIGFYTLKKLDSGEFYPFLGGLFNKYSNTGLGFTIIRKPIEEVIKRNGNFISTFVSSNNLPTIRAHVQQGYNLYQIQNVFIKHN
jgi:hypothetical protein